LGRGALGPRMKGLSVNGNGHLRMANMDSQLKAVLSKVTDLEKQVKKIKR